MRRQFLALILFFAPAVTMAQRYGRPYSLAPNPQVLLLEVKFQKQHHYFRAADFRKMPRSSVTVIDAATHASHVYEGVALARFFPATAHSQGEMIDVEFGSHQSITFSGTDLDPQSHLIVVDTVDGKPLSGYVPYYLVARFRGKPPQTITDVRCIDIHPA